MISGPPDFYAHTNYCDYYSPIPILSPFLFTPSLYVAIFNLQHFSFTCVLSFLMPYAIAYVVAQCLQCTVVLVGVYHFLMGV